MRLLEREQILADLGSWLNGPETGCIALVSGEAGVGKTSLLQAFCRRLDRRVLWGACDALFTPRPLAPLHDIARTTQGPLLTALSCGASRDRIFGVMLDELEHGPPAVVVFEDLHWADEATLDLLKYLGRRITRTRAMLLLTYRDDEVDSRHPLRFLIGDLPRTGTHRLTLQALSEPAVRQLASDAGRPAAELYAVTGGNPLFVSEILAAPAGGIPITVRDAVLARAARLSPAARQIAEIVCVVPGRTEPWLLASAGGRDEVAIDSCLGTGMVRNPDGSLAFRHELARRAFEDSLPPARRQELHTSVLDILVKQPGISAARLAHHADGAHNTRDVLRFARLAGAQAAEVGAHREAAAHFRLAVRNAEKLEPAERAALEEQRSYECYLTDRIEEALEARLAALAIWRAAGNRRKEGDALRWMSRLSWYAGRGAEAARHASAAVAILEPVGPCAELAMAYSNQSQLHMLAHDVPNAISWAQRTIELAESLDNREILCHALNNLGTTRAVAGDPQGWTDLERSLALALAGSFHEHAARAYTNLSSTAVVVREYERAARYLAEGLAYCEDHDLDSWRIYMLSFRARARFERVDWHGASADAEAVLRDPRTASISRITALTVLGHLRVLRGDPDSQSVLEEARSLAAATQELQRTAPLVAAFAEQAWLADDRAMAVKEILSIYELACRLADPWTKGMLATWLRRAGGLTEIPQDTATPYNLELSDDWRGAAGDWHQRGCRYEQAQVLGIYGAASEQLEALRIFEELGAIPAAQQLRRRMRASGIAGIPRGSRSSTRQDPYGLTRREAQILALLIEGLRNSVIATRLFVSTKTVDHHVSAILSKLGVSSRAQAIAMMRQRGEGA